MNQVLNFIRNDSGANAVEYSIILAVISIVIAVAAASIGNSLTTVFGWATAPFTGS